MAALLKFIVISFSSLVVILLLYEFAVRRTRLTRWLFGMRMSLPALTSSVPPRSGEGEVAV